MTCNTSMKHRALVGSVAIRQVLRVGLLFLITLLAPFSKARAADFIIVERPSRLLLYNQYQQRASTEESASLLPFTPFRILILDDVLGDGLTPCMKVSHNGTLFYLQKDDSGALVRRCEAGSIRTIRDAVALGDTVEVVTAAGLTLHDPAERVTKVLPRGSRCVRIFVSEGKIYVRDLGTKLYGWLDVTAGGEGKLWRAVREGPRAEDEMTRVLPSIVQRVQEVNTKLRLLFEYYGETLSGERSSRRVAAPQWRIETTAQRMRCVLETTLPLEGFRESSELLAKRIEGAVLGTRLRVQAMPGLIEVE